MRILRVHTWEGIRGGLEAYVWGIQRELVARGHSSHLFLLTTPGADLPPAPDETHVPVAAPSPRASASDLLDNAALRGEMDRVTEEFRPDLIHLHHITPAIATVGRWAARQTVPVVMTAHDAELVCPNESLMRPGGIVCEGGILPRCQFTGCEVGLGVPYKLLQREKFNRYAAPAIRAYISSTASLAGYLHTHGYRPTVYLPSFSRVPDEVRRAPTPFPSASAPRTVGYIGRIEWYKGLAPLLRAIALLGAEFPDVRLDVAGRGGAEAGVRALAAELGIAERVVFRGDVRGEEKERWFAGVHVVAVPSTWYEVFGIVAIEAQARGRPVVGSDIGGIPEAVRAGEGGSLVPVGDPSALAAALARYLSSPDLAQTEGERGRARVLREFSPERHVDRLLRAYTALLAGQPIPLLTEPPVPPKPMAGPSGSSNP